MHITRSHNWGWRSQPFIIARATPCEVPFGLFLAQIAPSLQNKKRALHANLRLDLDKLAGPRKFSNACMFRWPKGASDKSILWIVKLDLLNQPKLGRVAIQYTREIVTCTLHYLYSKLA